MGYARGAQIRMGLATQRHWGGNLAEGGEWRLGEVLVELGICDEEQIARTLSLQADLKYCPISRLELPEAAVARVPVEVAVDHEVVPLGGREDTLVLAFHTPPSLIVLDMLRLLLSCEIEPVLASESGVLKAIQRAYGHRFDPPRPHGSDPLMNSAHGLLAEPLRRSDGAVILDLRPDHVRIRFAKDGRDVDHEVPLRGDHQEQLLGALGLEVLLSKGRSRSFDILPATLDDRELELMVVSQPHERSGMSVSLQRLNP